MEQHQNITVSSRDGSTVRARLLRGMHRTTEEGKEREREREREDKGEENSCTIDLALL